MHVCIYIYRDGDGGGVDYRDRQREGAQFRFQWRHGGWERWRREKKERPRCRTPPSRT